MNDKDKMKASVSWMYIKPYRSQLPQVKIIEGEEEITLARKKYKRIL